MTQPIHPMLERVARKLARRNIPGGVREKNQWVELQWQHYLPDARAAIQALLEPDEGQIRDVGDILYEAGMISGVKTDDLMIRTAYQAMLKPLLGDEG